MSIASRIQEIETHIGNAYTSIDNLGIDISNTNKNIYNISPLLDTFYESLPKVSGIGASLSLSPSLMGKIKLNEIQGDTLQENTPTPSSPVPIQSVTGLQNVGVCDKNILDYSTLTYGYVTNTGAVSPVHDKGEMCSDFIKVKPNTTYTFKIFETSSTYDNWFGIGEYASHNQNSFIQRDTMTTISQNYITFTTSATTNYVKVSARNLESATKVQFELGEATSYEPYKGNTYEVNLGKNLFDKTKNIINGQTFGPNGQLLNNSDFFYQNYYIPVTPNTTYTVSKTTGSNSLRICEYDSSKTFIKRDYEQQTITTSATTYFIRISNYKVQIDAMQLEKGSTPTSFSPYFTPIELNKISTYEDSIKKSTGKNLFDKSTITIGLTYTSSGTTTQLNNAFIQEIYISVLSSTNYTLSTTNNYSSTTDYRLQILEYDENKTFIRRNQGGSSVGNSYSITTGSTTKYVRLGASTVTLDELQFEQGSKTSYEPYGKVWYVTENIGKVVLNGTQTNPEVNTSLTNTTRVFYNYALLDNNSLENYGLCNQLVYNSNWSKDEQGFYLNNNDKKLIFRMNKSIIGTTVNEVNTYLSSHNLIVYYVQATPTYTVITNTELINQLESLNNAKSEDGTTNINVTSEDLSMILNVGVLKGE